jgi:DNA-binding response OmpR family regulator
MRILIAEDDQVLADGLLRTLRASGPRWTMWPWAARPTRR